MKKILALLCAASFIILAGCSQTPKDTPTTVSHTEETTTEVELTTVASASDVVSRLRDLRNTLYFNGSERAGEFNNSLNIPALNFPTKNAEAINQKIMGDAADDIKFFDEIKESNNMIKIDKKPAKTVVLSHKWRSFNQMTVIEVDCEYGLLGSEDTQKTARVYYYDRGNDKELTFEEILERLGTTKEALFTAFSTAMPKETGFTPDSVKGVFPDTDKDWHVMLNNGSKFLSAEVKAPA